MNTHTHTHTPLPLVLAMSDPGCMLGVLVRITPLLPLLLVGVLLICFSTSKRLSSCFSSSRSVETCCSWACMVVICCTWGLCEDFISRLIILLQTHTQHEGEQVWEGGGEGEIDRAMIRIVCIPRQHTLVNLILRVAHCTLDCPWQNACQARVKQ